MREVIIIGAGGHGQVVADVILASGDRVIGFLDDDPTKPDVIGPIDLCERYECEFVVAIGNAALREKIASKQLKWYTAVHPSAIISPSAQIGEGTVVMPNVVINANAVIGKHCIINTGAIIEHDNHVGNFVHVSVGAKLGGTVCVEKSTWIGMGTTVSNNISICEDCVIGAGGVVVRDINESGTYVGVPVRKIK